MHMYASALALSSVTVPPHLAADAMVPVLHGPQAQGDLLVFPTQVPSTVRWRAVPVDGVQVIRGEATGNTHWLHRGLDSTDVRWAAVETGEGVLVGHLLVPPGESALLIHTGEHGANGIGPGTYAIHRKRAKDVTVGRQQRDYLVED